MIINDDIATMVLVIRTTSPLSQCRKGVSFSVVLLGVARIASNKMHATHLDFNASNIDFSFSLSSRVSCFAPKPARRALIRLVVKGTILQEVSF